jgi:hypothetical protein
MMVLMALADVEGMASYLREFAPRDPSYRVVRFGAAGEDTPASDVGLLVEFDEGRILVCSA